jgi:hypothetical protein
MVGYQSKTTKPVYDRFFFLIFFFLKKPYNQCLTSRITYDSQLGTWELTLMHNWHLLPKK